jgi:hypothetical protein
MPKQFNTKKPSAPVSAKTTTKSSPSSKTGTKPVSKPASTKPPAGKPAAAKPSASSKSGPVRGTTPKAVKKISEAYEIPDYSEGIEIAEGTKPTFDPAGSLSTPVGTAMWAWIGTKADEAFNKDPQQKITVVFDPEDEELESFYNRIMAFQTAWYEANGEDPSDSIAIFKDPDETFTNKYREALGDENAEPGPRIEFKKKAKFDENGDAIPVPLFDAAGEPDSELKVWAGDKVCVEFSLGGYNSPSKSIGIGVKPYLHSVQLVEEGPRVGQGEGGKAGATFKKRGTVAKKPAKQQVEEEVVEESEDDLPF